MAFAFAAGCGRGQAHVRKENFAKLLGRVDVEAASGEREDALADALDLKTEALGEAVEHADVDADAGLFHAEEHGRERQIDLAVDALDAGFLSFFEKCGTKRADGSGGSGLRGGRGLVVARGYVGESLRGVGGIERVGEQHGVIHCAAQGNPRVHQEDAAPTSSRGCILRRLRLREDLRSSGVSGRRRARPGSAQTPTAKLACFSSASARSRRDCAGGSSSSVSFAAAGAAASSAKAKPLGASGLVERGGLGFGRLLDQFDDIRSGGRARAP